VSRLTIRFCLGMIAWASALLGSLSISRLPGDWGHGICGPWGCGPPLQSLVACHVSWLVVLGPATLLLASSRWLSTLVLRRVGATLAIVGLIGLLYFSRLKTEPPRAFGSAQTAGCGSILSRLG
jgi:hypothetical protein